MILESVVRTLRGLGQPDRPTLRGLGSPPAPPLAESWEDETRRAANARVNTIADLRAQGLVGAARDDHQAQGLVGVSRVTVC